jgi:hypothetical protein
MSGVSIILVTSSTTEIKVVIGVQDPDECKRRMLTSPRKKDLLN